ncbi:MAG: methyl-accepting chemotaxis protein, partial [Pseudobdellovibrionaceae bacterium]|nr:methyl-accepting chemotaxis protein [Pseudobdellovibrionaceae bacterium]
SYNSHQDIDKLLAAEDWLSVLSTYNRVVEKSDKGDYGVDAKQFSATITRVIDSVRGVIDPEITLTSASIHDAAVAAQRNFILCVATVFSLIVVSMLISVYITRAINAALKAVAELLSHGADAVAKIAVQVAMASQNLASSATEQASALQETTAAVEETKSMIKKNAENSSKSATLSQQSYETALKGKEAIIEMTGSIDGIAHSNAEIMAQNEVTNKELMDIVRVIREIEGKTKVINDIVFQTRLLSFNASVEAARAGEQGKGFAVVAEEVGNLAQMSGTSAREIQILLDNSVRLVDTIVTNTKQKMNSLSQVGKEKIEAGIVTAERCGDILQQIVANVAIVGQMTNEISSACHEQSEGITEINNAMTEMDTVAHQNSAACEQTSVAAEELKTHAGKLLSMVQQLEQVIHGSVQNPVQPVEVPARNVQVEDDEWDQAA